MDFLSARLQLVARGRSTDALKRSVMPNTRISIVRIYQNIRIDERNAQSVIAHAVRRARFPGSLQSETQYATPPMRGVARYRTHPHHRQAESVR